MSDFASMLRVLTLSAKVGHTGVFDAAVEAISATDKAVGNVYEAAQEAGYILMITADHGNAEQMKDPKTGNPFTAHTTNPVPFIMTGDPKTLKFVEEKTEVEKKDSEKANEKEEASTEEFDPPAICDVAPTVLDVMVSG